MQEKITAKHEKEAGKETIQSDILRQLEFSGKLSQEQLMLLQNTINDTLMKYNIKQEEGKKIDTVLEQNLHYLDDFLSVKRLENKSESTIYNYGNEISKFFRMIAKPIQEVTTPDIRKYIEYRKQHDGISNVTCNNIRMYMMSFFKYLMQEEIVFKNPMVRIAKIKKEQRVVDTLTDEEQEMIRCACKNERDLAIIDLLSGSGMRVSELTGLNKSDVDFEKGEVKVFGKGKKERICFLTGKAKVHLKWYLESRTDNNPALFVQAKLPFNRISKNGVEYILKNICEHSAIPRCRLYPHKYRSTLATNMIKKGADISQVQHILGHASSVTTELYVKTTTDDNKAAHKRYAS